MKWMDPKARKAAQAREETFRPYGATGDEARLDEAARRRREADEDRAPRSEKPAPSKNGE